MSQIRQAEFQSTQLGDGWMEVRIVYEAGVQQAQLHARGLAATLATVRFVVAFAGRLATLAGVEHELEKVWSILHRRYCSCGQTKH